MAARASDAAVDIRLELRDSSEAAALRCVTRSTWVIARLICATPDAYESLDTNAVAAVYPVVNVAGLQAAFNEFSKMSYDVKMHVERGPQVGMTAVIALWLVAVVTLIGEATGASQLRRSERSLAFQGERAFAAELKRSLRADDRQAVADLLRYPARVFVQHKPHPVFVKDRDSLAEMYDMVFTPHLRCAVAESREPADGEPRPKYPLLVARGVVSLAGGRIVAERLDGKYRITRLTSFGDTSTRRGRPRPVTFPAGRREVQLGGRVPEEGSDAYLVTARQGDRLQATISHFPAGSLALRVSRHETATFLSGVGNQGNVWSGRLNESGVYLVEVLRRATYCEPPVIAHLLTLSLT